MSQGYYEPPDPRTNKAPKHQKSAAKKVNISSKTIKPLTADEDVEIIKGELEARNPIEEIQNIRIRYEEPYVFISEALQNTARSSRDPPMTHPDVKIEITPNKLIIWDNAKGITKEKINKIFNLGKSGWGQGITEGENPFGQGFMSFIVLFNKVTVESNDVAAVFDWGKIEKEYTKTKTFDLSSAYDVYRASSLDKYGRGQFKVTLEDPTEYWSVEDGLTEAKKYAKGFNFKTLTINGSPVSENIFESPHGAITLNKKFGDKQGLQGWFAPRDGEVPEFFYFNQRVGYYWPLEHISGNVNILNPFYGEPTENRNSWQARSKKRGIIITENYIKYEAKKVAIEIVRHASTSTLKKVTQFITKYSDYNEYKRHIKFQLIGHGIIEDIEEDIREQNPNITEEEFKRKMQDVMSSESSLMEAAKEAQLHKERSKQELNIEQQEITKNREEIASKRETADEIENEILDEEEKVLDDAEEEITEKFKEQQKEEPKKEKLLNKNEEGYTLSDITKTTFWLSIEDVLHYQDEIKNAEYHGFQIAIAHNDLQQELFTEEHPKFLHIRNFSFSQNLESKIFTVGPKNAEERRIQWIFNTFLAVSKYKDISVHIADYQIYKILTIPNTSIKEKEPMDAGGYTLGKDIYIQRKLSFGHSQDGALNGYFGIKALRPFLKYNEYPLENKTIGWGDIAIFLKVLPLLAHELAHAAYHTTDNTQEHMEVMTNIIEEFNTIIAEHHGKTVLSKGSTIKPTIKKELHITDSDTIAVTYFKGSEQELEKQPQPQKVKEYKTGEYVLYREEGVENIVKISDLNKDGTIVIEYLSNFKTISPTDIEPLPVKPGNLYYYKDKIAFIEKISEYTQNISITIYNDKTDITPKRSFTPFYQDFTPLPRKEQSEFIENIVYIVLKEHISKDIYSTIPIMQTQLHNIMPLDYYALEYIIKKKLTNVIQKTNQKYKGQVLYKWTGE